jgi:hypothetical protein
LIVLLIFDFTLLLLMMLCFAAEEQNAAAAADAHVPRHRLSGDFHSSSFLAPAVAPHNDAFHVDPNGDMPYRIHNFGDGEQSMGAAAPYLADDQQPHNSGPYHLWHGQ